MYHHGQKKFEYNFYFENLSLALNDLAISRWTSNYGGNCNKNFKIFAFLSGLGQNSLIQRQKFCPFSPALWVSQIAKSSYLHHVQSHHLNFIVMDRALRKQDLRVAQMAPSDVPFRKHCDKEGRRGCGCGFRASHSRRRALERVSQISGQKDDFAYNKFFGVESRSILTDHMVPEHEVCMDFSLAKKMLKSCFLA